MHRREVREIEERAEISVLGLILELDARARLPAQQPRPRKHERPPQLHREIEVVHQGAALLVDLLVKDDIVEQEALLRRDFCDRIARR